MAISTIVAILNFEIKMAVSISDISRLFGITTFGMLYFISLLNVVVLSVIMFSDVQLSVIKLNVVVQSAITLGVIMLSDITLSVIKLNVVVLSVVAPLMDTAIYSYVEKLLLTVSVLIHTLLYLNYYGLTCTARAMTIEQHILDTNAGKQLS